MMRVTNDMISPGNIIKEIKLNNTLLENNHRLQWIAQLIVAGTAFTENIWLITVVLFAGTLVSGMKKLLRSSLYEVDAYTYMAFPVSFKEVCISKVISGGTQLLALNLVILAEIKILRYAVFKGETSVMGTILHSWFMEPHGDNAAFATVLQATDAVLLCYCIPAVYLLLVTADKLLFKNGHYANTILVCIFLFFGIWMIGESYTVTFTLALIQLAAIIAALLFCLWQSWSFMEQVYYIRDPVDY